MQKTKSDFVAIIGRPNVGKSSLLNLIIGEKIAIVSDKPQTTRTRITGVLTEEETQFVFFDTPGFHKGKTKLSEYMLKSITNSVADVDICVFMTEAKGAIKPTEEELLNSCKVNKIPTILVINKIDLLSDKTELLKKIETFNNITDLEFKSIIPISVTQNDGIDILMNEIRKFAKEGPHYFDDDALTDQPEKIICGEIIREKLLLNLNEEIPHGTGVIIEKMKDRDDKPIIDIEAVILCEKNSHKGIIIGKNGAKLKKIASEARCDIENFLDVKVNLQCWVKVKEDWRNRESIIRELGFSKD